MTPPASNGYVPWSVYVEDRRATTDHLVRIEDKLDRVLERQTALEVSAAHDDGAESATGERLKTRAEHWWDVTRTAIASILGVAATLVTMWITGS